MSESRFEDIEAKVAYQEHTIQELNDRIFEQQKQIDRLEATCKILIERYRELSEQGGGIPAADEKPPHY